MKKLFLIFAASSIFLASCESDSKKYTTVDSSIMSEQQISKPNPDECFVYSKNKDSVKLRMWGTGNNILLGQLNYNLFEKDKNSGPIYGVEKGDTIIVDYKFESEGVYSKRQIVWLKQGDKLLEGIGDIYQVNGDVKFKDISKLTFGKSIILEKTDCK
ncbi:hypothetical protein [Pedobacter jamesrossensis]|uniref:Lipoprotein n=1 Tax=Pedobacter jamesrossensis TaxID=1908238 RepID=A0ABV8NU47_9SPHI